MDLQKPIPVMHFKDAQISYFLETYPLVIEVVNKLLLQQARCTSNVICLSVKCIREELSKVMGNIPLPAMEFEDVFRNAGWDVKYSDQVYTFKRGN